MAKLKDGTKVITNPVRLSYANIWEPKAINGSDPKYSASLLIAKTDTETINYIKQAVENAKEAGKSTKFKGKIPANLKLPLRDGDEERPDDPSYAGHYFVNANATSRPGIVDKHRVAITDEEEVYSGCYARVSVSFFPYDSNGSKGIACGLNNIQKHSDGDRLSGRASAADDFDDDYSESSSGKDFDDDDML